MKQTHTTYQNTPNSLGLSDGNTALERDQFYFIKDHLGSSGYLTDINGKAIQHIEIDQREIREPPLKCQEGSEQYLPFGELLLDQKRADWGTVYKYNGKELDCESGYYYYGARYYNPGLGRFLSVDPLAHKMPSWSPFTYTFNNPLRFTDPTGMEPESKDWEPKLDKNNNIQYVSQEGDSYETFVEQYGDQAAQQIFEANCGECYDKNATYSEGEVRLNSEKPLKLITGSKKPKGGSLLDMFIGGSGNKSTADIQDVYNQLEFINKFEKGGSFSMNDYFSHSEGSEASDFKLSGSLIVNGETFKKGFINYNHSTSSRGLLPSNPSNGYPVHGFRKEYRYGNNPPSLIVSYRNDD